MPGLHIAAKSTAQEKWRSDHVGIESATLETPGNVRFGLLQKFAMLRDVARRCEPVDGANKAIH